MANVVVTIHINDANLRLLVASGKCVSDYAEVALDPGLVKDGVVIDPVRVAAKIKDILRAKKIPATRATVAVSGLHSLCRVITLPTVPRSVLPEAVKHEAERVLAVPLEQFYLTWQTLEASKEEMKLFLTAVPRNTVDAMVATLQHADLKAELIDLAPLALARVVNRMTSVRMPKVMVVNIHSREIDIVLLVDGVPQLVRSLYIPGELSTLQDKLTSVREELGRTIKFYNSTRGEDTTSSMLPIFVVGEADQTEILKICKMLGGDTEGQPFLPLLSPLKWPRDLVQRQFMVNVGLALKKLAPGGGPGLSRVNLNILPGEHRPKPPSLKKYFVAAGFGIAVAAIGLMAVVVQGRAADNEALSEQIQSTGQVLQTRQAEQRVQEKKTVQLEQQVAAAEHNRDAFVTVLSNFDSHQAIIDGDLYLLLDCLSSGLVLTDIRHIGSEMIVNGVADDEIYALDYADDVMASGRFDVLELTRIARDDGRFDFVLTLARLEGEL